MAGSLEQLTEAVLEAPDDDAPRLSLAAALAAKGDPRGEFIHAQVELARLAPGDERDRLARRARELLVRHEAEWVEPVADAVTAWRFHRGFIDDVTLDAEVLLANAETLFTTAPIRSLRVHEAGGLAVDLAACPSLPASAICTSARTTGTASRSATLALRRWPGRRISTGSKGLVSAWSRSRTAGCRRWPVRRGCAGCAASI